MGRITAYLSAQGIVLAQDPKRKMLAFDRELEVLEEKVQSLTAENLSLRAENATLKRNADQRGNAPEKSAPSAHLDVGNPEGHVCDHCGSPRLKRTGNRLDETFGALGIKAAVFTCSACGQESAFTIHAK